jgi:DNA-binding response OmpR family regulator
MRVLVVDDDAESRELLTEVLEANGYQVGAAGDGRVARDLLSQDGDYDVVIADLRMPNATGLDLMREMRQRHLRQHIILMSSFISGPERDLALELGARALLEKPFRLSELLNAVGEIAALSSVASTE